MTDTTIKTSELSSRNILISADTQFIILDKGITTQGPHGSTMIAPASAVISLIGSAYNLNNLSNLTMGFASQSANNVSNYTTVNTNSALNWNYQGTDVKSLTAEWQNTTTTVNTNSATWATGGSGANGMAGFAFINTTTGNNATAVLGDPMHPYATANAGASASQAFLGGANIQMYLQTSCLETLSLTEACTIWLYGDTYETSFLDAINLTGVIYGTTRIIGNGPSRVGLKNLSITGVPGPPGADGVSDGEWGGNGNDGNSTPPMDLRELSVANITSIGGMGGNGGNGAYGDSYGGNGGNGGSGQYGGDITLTNCNLQNGVVQSIGGNGGNGGSGGSSGFTNGSGGTGGNSGNGGNIIIYGSKPFQSGTTIDVTTGTGSPGTGDSGSGTPGIGGQLHASWSEFSSYTTYSGLLKMCYVSGAFQSYLSI